MSWRHVVCLILSCSVMSAASKHVRQAVNETDGSVTNEYVTGEYETYTYVPSGNNPSQVQCGGDAPLTSEGTIMSPNYPDNYPNYANCNWTIQAPANKSIKLVFDKFDVELNCNGCDWDDLTIVDGGRIKKMCGDRSGYTYISDCNSGMLMLKFKSDYVVTRGGFKIPFTFVECESEETSPEPPSPCYPTGSSSYPSTSYSSYPYSGSSSYPYSGCSSYPYSGCSSYPYSGCSSYPYSGCSSYPYSGCSSYPYSGSSSYPYSGSSSYSYSGSSNYYPTEECEETINSNGTSQISSKNFPNNYPNNTGCTRTIPGVENMSIKLFFNEFNVEYYCYNCSWDYVTITDEGRSYPNKTQKMCGVQSGYTFVSNPDSNVTLTFFADSIISKPGFKITYSYVPSDTTEATALEPPEQCHYGTSSSYTSDYSTGSYPSSDPSGSYMY